MTFAFTLFACLGRWSCERSTVYKNKNKSGYKKAFACLLGLMIAPVLNSHICSLLFALISGINLLLV